MKENIQDEAFKTDIQIMINEVRLAAATHEMEHANNIFKMLHDMDYFLLRYGIEDVGQYMKNNGMVGKYYGVLSVCK